MEICQHVGVGELILLTTKPDLSALDWDERWQKKFTEVCYVLLQTQLSGAITRMAHRPECRERQHHFGRCTLSSPLEDTFQLINRSDYSNSNNSLAVGPYWMKKGRYCRSNMSCHNNDTKCTRKKTRLEPSNWRHFISRTLNPTHYKPWVTAPVKQVSRGTKSRLRHLSWQCYEYIIYVTIIQRILEDVRLTWILDSGMLM